MANEFIARNGITSLGDIVVSGSLTTTGAITISGSIASASFATNAATASSADNLLVRSTLTAQTLVVQTITSSVDFVTGSTQFGSLLSNTHVFSGSVTMNPGGLFVSSSGNVGIGTIPNTTAGITELAIGSSNTNPLISGIRDGVSAFALSSDSIGTLLNERRNLDLRFSSNNTERMRITSTGNVGIGTTSPLSLLDVNVLANGARRLLINYDDSLVTIKSANASATAESLRVWGDNIYFYTGSAGSELMRLTNTGRVGIGTTSLSYAKFNVYNNTNDATYNVRIQAVFGNSDYLGSDGANGFGSGASETQFLNGSSTRPAIISLGGSLSTDEALGAINFFRSGNTDTYRTRVTITGVVQSTGTAGQHGGYLSLRTAADSQTNPSERVRITSDGAMYMSRISSDLTFADSVGGMYVRQNGNPAGTQEELRLFGRSIGLFSHSGTRYVTITSDNRVGIGTSTPSGSRLHVFIGNDGGSGTPGVILATSNGANDIVRFQDGTTTVAVVKNNGNIGILNTDPQSRLHIGSALASSSDITNGFILKQTGTNETTGIYLERSGERKGYAIYIGGSLDSLVFQRNNAGTKSDVLTLTRDGYILMGTSSVGYGLFSAPRLTINPVNDGITVGPLTQNKSAYTVQADNSTGQRYALYIANSSSSEVGYISFTNSAVNYTSTSDYRLKKDLKSFKGIDLINLIKTYDFAWKIDDSRMYGVIAHELQEVLPYAVTGEKDGETMQGVDYGKLTPVLVKAIQELKAENDSLKSRIEILESK